MVTRMNGKMLKVAQYNLEFGKSDRFVNVFGCFKYKSNGNNYVIYTDVDTKYPIIYYGSAHVKEKNILSMQCKNESEQEIIKEYIYKVINNEPLENFEIFSLEEVESIEIIASNKIDVKPEIISSLVNITLPKKEEPEVIATPISKKKKKKSFRVILVLLLIFLVGGIGYFYITSLTLQEGTARKIICQKEYQHKELNAFVHEENTYNFNNRDSLENIDTVITYQFEKSDYQEFILKGTYYKYLPDDDQVGGYKKDDENYIFKIITTEEVSTSYNKPTVYEEVFSYYKSEGYTCTEEIAE